MNGNERSRGKEVRRMNRRGKGRDQVEEQEVLMGMGKIHMIAEVKDD
jgi:hypothetical protein